MLYEVITVETNPWEGVINNVVAFKTLFEVASSYLTEKFVLVSSDKAVRPTNIMGATNVITSYSIHYTKLYDFSTVE